MNSENVILLVEDNDDDAFLMKRAFKAAGVKNPLHIVEDGQAAMDYLSGEKQFSDRAVFPLPVVIFLDLKLPLKSGHEVLAWARKREELINVVIVVLTSSNEKSDLTTSYRLGANSYLVKPPTADQLIDMAKAFKWYWLDYNQFPSHS